MGKGGGVDGGPSPRENIRFSSSVSMMSGLIGVALCTPPSHRSHQLTSPIYNLEEQKETYFLLTGSSATIVNAHVNSSGFSPCLNSPSFLTSIEISILDFPTYETKPERFRSQKWLRGEMMEILSTAAVTTVRSGPVCYIHSSVRLQSPLGGR